MDKLDEIIEGLHKLEEDIKSNADSFNRTVAEIERLKEKYSEQDKGGNYAGH